MSRVNLLLKPVLCLSTIDFIASRNTLGNYQDCVKILVEKMGFSFDDVTLSFSIELTKKTLVTS